MLQTFYAAYYSQKNRQHISDLIVADLDTAHHLWGGGDYTRSFRNLLVGAPELRGETWQAWISTRELDLAEDEAFYILHQAQTHEGKQIDRWGIYATLPIDCPLLFTHENVQPEGVERARQGTEACESDVAPIFIGCDEAIGTSLRELLANYAKDLTPLMRANNADGSHAVWPVEEQKVAAEIRRLFGGVPLFLLDGHHRLAAAKENHRIGLGDGKILVCICSMAKQDTLILPIHRAVNYEKWILPEAMTADLARAGCGLVDIPSLTVQGIPEFLETHRSDKPFCVVLHSHTTKPLVVELPPFAAPAHGLAQLAVSCLENSVFASVPQATVMPVPNFQLALEQLAHDQAQTAFFLPAATPGQVRSIALGRQQMPRKSTRFSPKPCLGLICRPWMA